MKKICSLMFVFTLIIIGGLITNVDAVSLSNTDGRITVTRQVTKVHNPVTNTFKYAVKAYPNNPKAVTGLPSTFNIVFNRTAPVIESGDWEGTATGTGTLDLTGINFTEPGDYYFHLWEQNSTNQTNYPVVSNTGYIFVTSVRNVVDGNNRPTGTVTASFAYIKNNSDTKVSNAIFSNEFKTMNEEGGPLAPLAIAKEVQGNMADPDEYFKVLVNIDCPSGDAYKMTYYDTLNDSFNVSRTINYNNNSINRLPNAETVDGETSYYATYTCGQNNYVYLKHGEEVNVLGLLNGTEYSFIEQDATNYDTYINRSSTNSKDSGDLSISEPTPISDQTCGEIFSDCDDKSNIIGKEIKPKNMANETPTIPYDINIILNVESSPVPTGMIIKYLPYAILLLVVIGSLIFFGVEKKKTKESKSSK